MTATTDGSPPGASGDSPKAKYGSIRDERMSAEEMDGRRKENMAYEYLCHLEEAKIWMEACISEELPLTTELEEGIRNGIALAKLAHFMTPESVPVKKIYDKDYSRYQARGLHFKHTDNINHWLRSLKEIGLPQIFYPETTDIYDRKNMPRVMYCIHALSLFLFKLGKAPQIQDLYGKIKFTEEEISAMKKELEKYGIQMPTFSKIGGILANEMPVDEAALHAAVIAINEAIDHQVALDTMAALQIPEAHLVNIELSYAEKYQEALYAAKCAKAEVIVNKSLDPDYVADVYDELLTQAEIQGNINKTNLEEALERVRSAVDKQNVGDLQSALTSPHLGVRHIKPDNAQAYMTCLVQTVNSKQNNDPEENDGLTKEDVQCAVEEGNRQADIVYQRFQLVSKINLCLESGGGDELMSLIQNPAAGFPEVHNYAANLYFQELRNMRREKQADLDHEEISGALKVLSALAVINKNIEAGDMSATWKALMQEDAHLTGLDEESTQKYQHSLAKAAKNKGPDGYLSHFDIQNCVDEINNEVQSEHERILAIAAINDAIDIGSVPGTLEALQLPSAKLAGVQPYHAYHYQTLLSKIKKAKAQETDDVAAVLWWEEIQDSVHLTNRQADDANKLSVGIAAINIAIEMQDLDNLLTGLQNRDVALHSVTNQCVQSYLDKLQHARTAKMQSGDIGSGWMMNRTREGHKFYFNTVSMECNWEKPKGCTKDHSLLTREEIQACISEVSAAHDRQMLFKANERFIIQVQAYVRGMLARDRFRKRYSFLKNQLPAIILIQSWWRMIRQRRRYLGRLRFLRSHDDAAVKIQSLVKMHLTRKKFRQRLKFYQDHVSAVVKIQAFIRSNWARQDYKALMYADNPAVSVVGKFVHLLDQNDADYTEEIELQNLRHLVVTEIRSLENLENDLNTMDIKIGLLVKNRITLQDVVSQNKKLKHHRESSNSTLIRGLKALSKESRERLEAYQHLFYLLQTQPTYLARLIFELPQSRTTKFMESVILALYNYASNHREEYLLLRLFKTALEEEIRSKVDQMSDIVTGNPLVVKMIVSFNRNARGQSALRELLNPLVKAVLEDRNLSINTNPVEVYKAWINQTETQTGTPSGLPYDVTVEQALQHPEVQERLKSSINDLRHATDKFLQAILQSLNQIPYGMRYMAKVLKNSLRTKFPDAPEKDILKLVGNLIYYRYINSAIVAPDAFDVIDVSINKGLTNDQRRNLGSIAKILQFAASNKGFGGDSAHLSCLNSYIMEAHEKFKKFFCAACEVEEPEVYFNIDQYTDVTRVTKPVIYISIREIIDTHQLLLEHQDVIAPDPNDVMHQLLDELGEAPDVDTLIGDSTMDPSNRSQLARAEISLTLTNRFEVTNDDDTDKNSLLIRTKRMIVDVIRCQTGDNLSEILKTPATDQQEEEHQLLIRRRERVDQRAVNKKAKLIRQQSMVGDTRLPLDCMKERIKRNLAQLEELKLVSSKDHYQGVINNIVQDIRNQRLYRQRRKQEMMRIRGTLASLATKRRFYEEQIDYYNQYVKTCLDNLAKQGKKAQRTSWFGRQSGQKAKGCIKYSAVKLQEKGVLHEIEGLPPNQFKNVLFEISATEVTGVFDVNAKFMGVSMDKVELVFQDLLQLQYEGVAVMKMFDKAKVNVNLLIFLLNKKFYYKK